MFNKLLAVMITIVVILLALAADHPQRAAALTKTIEVKGSDTMVNLGQAWAETFMNETRIPVAVTGGGSGTGIAALINDKTDICETSRPMTNDEIQQARRNGVAPLQTIIAWDGIAVVVNPGNPVKKLTESQLAAIYAGKITNWREVGGKNSRIILLGRELNSGTYLFFKERIVQQGNPKSAADYAKSAMMLPSNQAVHDEVAGNPNAIGYIGLGYVTQKVHAIAVSTGKMFVMPTINTVRNKTYPLSRPLYWYTNGQPKGDVKKLLDFALSSEGQQIVAQMDFVPKKLD